MRRIQIELELHGTPPSGSATVAGGEPRPFVGYMGLMAAVLELVRDGEREQGKP
jgi:hypothetical protein